MPTQDYSPQVNQAFNLLRKGLRPFVEDQMKSVYGDRWYNECHYAGVRPSREGDYTWDVQALLKVVTNSIFWRDVFVMAKRRGAEERGVFVTLLELRHEVDAHRDDDLPKEKAKRVLKHVVDALECIDAKEQVQEAEDLLHSLSLLLVGPSAQPVSVVTQQQEDNRATTVTTVAPPIEVPNPVVALSTALVLPAEAKPLSTGRTIDFWGAYHFDFADALNEEIWQLSPAVQQEIQPSSTLRRAGVIGAQQAMLDSPLPDGRDALPWVPDLVGKQWRDADALVIVGSAYAGFIREYSTRNATIPLN